MNLLIVDDHPTNLKLLRAQLESEGHAVFEAHDGVDALALLERQPVDAVISDILMPRMDGYRLCHEIRKHVRLHDLRIILYTATYTSPGDEKLTLDVGADKYLKRPVSLETLVAALHEVIAQPHVGPRPEALQEIEVPKEYNEKLVSKLKEKNTELQAQAAALTAEIAERKRAESQRLRLLETLEASLNEIYMFDPETLRFFYVNRGALRNLGYTLEDMHAFTPFHLKPEYSEASFRKLISPLIDGKREKIQFEATHRRSDGSFYPVEVHLQLVQAGESRTFLAIILDITERKRAELELRRSAQRMQSLSRRLVAVREEEQHRLSAELHDGIGQNLAALSINLNLIGSMIPLESQPKLAERLRDSQGLLEKSIAFARDLITELRPPALHDYGLLAGLRWYGAQVQMRTGMATVVEGDEPLPRLAGPVEGALFRIAKEALTNTVKHARARKASLGLRSNGGKITLMIADDGAGFDLTSFNQPGPRTHWGLMMMRERAEAVGARLSMESAPGQGTRIVVEVARTA